MKKLNVAMFSLIFLCASFFLCACGEKKDFDVDKIHIDDNVVFVYDGEQHCVDITYDNKKVDVKYALVEDSNNYKSLSELDVSDAGSYSLFYKLSKKGYNDYYSDKSIQFTILPRDLEIDIYDYTLMKHDIVIDPDMEISVGYTSLGIVKKEDVGLKFHFGDDYDVAPVDYDKTYTISCSISNPNYVLTSSDTATMYVQDYVYLEDKENNFISYFGTIQEAIDNAEPGSTVVLNSNIFSNKVINVDKSIVIDGQNTYEIWADYRIEALQNESETLKSIFNISSDVNNSEVELTLKDVVLNGGGVARCVSAFNGKVIVDGANIKNGLKDDSYCSGGVYIAGDASFEMKRGTISGNSAQDDEHSQYCADLWLGTNSVDSLVSVTGGSVGNAFVSSGKFTLDGGIIENVYVKYNSVVGSVFEYEKGAVDNLLISVKSDNNYGIAHEVEAVEGRTYYGGQLVYAESKNQFSGNVYDENIDSILEDGETYVFENCRFYSSVVSSKKVEIVFNNCEFIDSSVNLSGVNNLVVNNCQFTGSINNSSAIDVNLHSSTCEDIIIANNTFDQVGANEDVAISIKARLGRTDIPSYASNPWAEGATEGKILGTVLVAGNSFTSANNKIYVGTNPQGSSFANSTTGDFHVVICDNLTELNVYNLFKYNAYQQPAVESIEIDGSYDSNN